MDSWLGFAKDLQATATAQLRQAVDKVQSTVATEAGDQSAGGKENEARPAGGGGQDEAKATTEKGLGATETTKVAFKKLFDVAKDMAHNARATAEDAQGQLREFTENVKKGSASLPGFAKTTDSGESELDGYGVTPDLVACVKTSMTPKEFLAKSKEWPKEDNPTWKLTPWQEKHVLLILTEAAELRDCRYLLTPKKMSEQRFWEIYFALTQKHLFTSSSPSASASAKSETANKTEAEREGGAASSGAPTQPDDEAGRTATPEGSAAAGAEDDEDADDLSDDLEAYLESVLANKDDGSEGEMEEADEDDLDEYINELEVDMGSMSDDQEIVKVEVTSPGGSKVLQKTSSKKD